MNNMKEKRKELHKILKRRVELAEDILDDMISLNEGPHKIERWKKKVEEYRIALAPVYQKKGNCYGNRNKIVS